MRFTLTLIITLLLILSACQKVPQPEIKQTNNQVTQPIATSNQTNNNLPDIIAKDTLINGCPQFSDLTANYDTNYRSYISILSTYHALFKTSKDVQEYKIRGGVGSKGDIIIYCAKGLESLKQDPNLIYCSGDSTNAPIFAESFITNTDGSTKKIQKRIILLFNLEGSFHKTECK
jgi:hypothetical protein